MEKEPSLSKRGVQVVPPFTVFHTPPEATATYQVSGCSGSTARSPMRPEVTAGPRLRQVSPSKVEAFIRVAGSALPLAGAHQSAPEARTSDRIESERGRCIDASLYEVCHHHAPSRRSGPPGPFAPLRW